MYKSSSSKKLQVSKTQIAGFSKVAIWGIAVVVTTIGLSAGYVAVSQAFGAEDKASAVELCRFGEKNVTSFGQMRTVTTGAGTHIFLQSQVRYSDKSTAGLIAFKETITEDPCQGVTSIKADFEGQEVSDISSTNWYLYDWDMINAVFIPELYSENNDDGYIAVFLRERTGGYTKQLAVSLMKYQDNKISFMSTTPVFSDNANFSNIVDAHYSYETASLYLLGTTQSEGIRGRSMRLASISQEDLLLGTGEFYYCKAQKSADAQHECDWDADVTKATSLIATKTGEMDLIGLNDNVSLMLQNTGKAVMVYDLAADGAFWNPGLTLLDCSGTEKCDQIIPYDYQMAMFENEEESVKIMNFDFIQAYKGQAILYEATINDFSVSQVASLWPSLSINLPLVDAKSAKSNDKASKKIGASEVYDKKRADAPHVENARSKVKTTNTNTYTTDQKKNKSMVDLVKNAFKKNTTRTSSSPSQGTAQNNQKKVNMKRVDQTQAANQYAGMGATSGNKKGKAVVRAPAAPKNGVSDMKSKNKKTGKNSCDYGSLNNNNKEYCRKMLPKCDKAGGYSGLHCSEGSLKHAAYAKCVSGGDQVASCCPKGTHIQNGKCVKYVDEDAKDQNGKKVEYCKYGSMKKMSAEEKKYCQDALPNCNDGKSKSSYKDCVQVKVKYAAYTKCVVSDAVWACCPNGATADTKTGTCRLFPAPKQ